MRMASCVPGELILCAFVWHDPPELPHVAKLDLPLGLGWPVFGMTPEQQAKLFEELRASMVWWSFLRRLLMGNVRRLWSGRLRFACRRSASLLSSQGLAG